ncbi:Ig-like domain-containing protein [Brevibacillus dissolubilis]|uniref:Ig-like domain-containing protein n=1 Tax=Brevibacillus dissolubilis TaxID=1844116 RepID=UPI0011168ADE|nr:Ig-like domain-containing protein [Brevibacillus dissolubilis]
MKNRPHATKRMVSGALLSTAVLLTTIPFPTASAQTRTYDSLDQTAVTPSTTETQKELLVSANGTLVLHLPTAPTTPPTKKDFALTVQIGNEEKLTTRRITSVTYYADTQTALVKFQPLLPKSSEVNVKFQLSYDGSTYEDSFTLAPKNTKVEKVDIINLSQDASLTYGDETDQSLALQAVATDKAGHLVQVSRISWKSSNPAVASVNASGIVTAKKAGTAVITASVSGKKATFEITVNDKRDLEASLELGSNLFSESATTDGVIENPILVHLKNATFASDLAAGDVYMQHVPEGLTMHTEKQGDDQLLVSFYGRAVKHESTESRDDLRLFVKAGKVITKNGPSESELSTDAISIRFHTPQPEPPQPPAPPTPPTPPQPPADTTAPVITGVANGDSLRDQPVTPVSADTDIQTVTLTKNGSPVAFALGDTLSDSGAYVLTATDQSGNSTTVSFTLITSTYHIQPTGTSLYINTEYADQQDAITLPSSDFSPTYNYNKRSLGNFIQVVRDDNQMQLLSYNGGTGSMQVLNPSNVQPVGTINLSVNDPSLATIGTNSFGLLLDPQTSMTESSHFVLSSQLIINGQVADEEVIPTILDETDPTVGTVSYANHTLTLPFSEPLPTPQSTPPYVELYASQDGTFNDAHLFTSNVDYTVAFDQNKITLTFTPGMMTAYPIPTGATFKAVVNGPTDFAKNPLSATKTITLSSY